MQLALRRRDQLEMPASVTAAYQPGAHSYRAGQPAMRRDVADAEPDPAVRRPVRRRTMPAQRVMQRKAARRQLHHRGAAFVEWFDDRLTAAVDAVHQAERGVAQLARFAARRGDFHAAGFGAGVTEGHPGGDMLVRVEPEI